MKPSLARLQEDQEEAAWAGEVHPVAALVCAFGFFMRILLSAPVLNIFGIDYGSDDASSLFAKIHPATWVILLSFLILLFSRRNPVEQTIRIARQQTAFFTFFSVYIVILVYWLLRGPKGVGVILDVHLVMPICLIVFCYAPIRMCRQIVYLFAAFAVGNSLIGIFESATHLRVFPFDPEWEVLKQDYFRASALLGHPLTNAAFAAVSMFVLLSLRMGTVLKAVIFIIMLASLVGFGSRSALGFAIAGVSALGGTAIIRHLATGRLSVLQLMLAVLAVFVVPMLCFALLYGVLHSEMGERLMAYSSLNDDSAGVRLQALQAFSYMTPSEVMLGMDGDRIADIGLRTGVASPTSDIENPWMLMFMFLGAIMFVLWFSALGFCLWRLMAGASPALKFAVIEYFLISSTSNSFGRKDPVYMIMAGIVLCAKRVNDADRQRMQRQSVNQI